ncbi:PKD domain-containing protein [Candidatus Fermentibacteria bacterium]|nr:PKD domain-containing protein [Candidatus Fermentibacteria bacterium]
MRAGLIASAVFTFLALLPSAETKTRGGEGARSFDRRMGSGIGVPRDSLDTGETRAVWLNHYAFDSPEKRAETLQKITNANLNTVFLIVPDDTRPAWSTVADFSAMLTGAKALGLGAHVWMINLWRTAGQTADFTDPAEQEAQTQWARTLLDSFPTLDGIHFDYIRYETQDRLDSVKMHGIRQTVLQTYQALQTEYPGRFLTAALINMGQDCADWVHSYPEGGDDIPSWFRTWFPANPGNRWDDLSFCDAYPTPDGVPTQMTFQQDGVSLVNDDALDFIIAMEYTYHTSWWSGEVDIWHSFLGPAIGHVYMGLGWYSSVWNGAGVTPGEVAAEIVNKIAYGRSHGIDGFSLFEFGEPGTNDSIVIHALTEGPEAPFAEPARSCLLSQPIAEFTADTVAGTAPLIVHYSDLSTGAIVSWEWDLDGDDVIDSTSRNPSFVYANPGTYTVSLTVTNGENNDTEIKEHFITVFGLDAPEITSVLVYADEITIAWNPVAGAMSYGVYSSVMPYTGFALDTTGIFTGESWQAPVSGDQGFFCVVALSEGCESDASVTVGFVARDLR